MREGEGDGGDRGYPQVGRWDLTYVDEQAWFLVFSSKIWSSSVRPAPGLLPQEPNLPSLPSLSLPV